MAFLRYAFFGFSLTILGLVLNGGAFAQRVIIPDDNLQIHSMSANHIFDIIVVADDESRQRGLMEVESLPDNHGMLFDFEEPRTVGIWMKNTPLSLDILYISATGEILMIAAQAEPFSLRRITSPAPVLGVLEIRGGLAEMLGIQAGDTVHHDIFGNGLAKETARAGDVVHSESLEVLGGDELKSNPVSSEIIDIKNTP